MTERTTRPIRRSLLTSARRALATWRWWPLLAPVVGYLLLAIFLTWPLLLDLDGHYVGNRPLDIWSHSWNLWWVRYALTELRTNPFVTTHVFYPEGVELYLHVLSPLAGLISLPIGLVWGPTVAYNGMVLLALTLNGWATNRLARRWLPALPAAVAGLAFAAAPWVLHQLRVGHLNLMNAGWVPLALLALLRASDRGRSRDLLLAALSLLAATLIDWQHAVFLALAGVVLIGERLLTAPSGSIRWRRLGALVGAAGLYGLLVAPLVVAALRQGGQVAASVVAKLAAERIEYSADLLAYVMPQLLHPLWGRPVTAWLIEHPLGAPTEGRVGLGLAVLLLAAIALISRRPGAGLWGVIGLSGLLLSLGPRLHIAGYDTGLPGPYTVLADLPLISFGRTPARFALLVALAGALLAGLGLQALRDWVGRRWGGSTGRMLSLMLAGLILFEYLPLPYPTAALPSLTLAEQVATLAGDGTVLELPYQADHAPRLLYQMVHRRPIFGGYVTRPPATDFVDLAPVLSGLMKRVDEPDIVGEADARSVLATFRVRVIVVYRPPYYRPDVVGETPSEAQLRRRVQQVLGVAGPTWEDATGALYQVPPGSPVVVTTFTQGWHAVERDAEGLMRWMRASAELRLDRPRSERLTVRFAARSFYRPRTLTVLLDDRPLTTLSIPVERRSVMVTLPAGSGPARLTLRVAEGTDVPVAFGIGADIRPLSLAISNLSIGPAG